MLWMTLNRFSHHTTHAVHFYVTAMPSCDAPPSLPVQAPADVQRCLAEVDPLPHLPGLQDAVTVQQVRALQRIVCLSEGHCTQTLSG
jgi:hypothetical protein